MLPVGNFNLKIYIDEIRQGLPLRSRAKVVHIHSYIFFLRWVVEYHGSSIFVICSFKEWWCGYIQVIQNLIFHLYQEQYITIAIFHVTWMSLQACHISTWATKTFTCLYIIALFLAWAEYRYESLKKGYLWLIKPRVYSKNDTSLYHQIYFNARLTLYTIIF